MSALVWARRGVLLAVLLALLAFALVYPLIVNGNLYLNYGIETLLFTGGVVAWNMFSGFTGYISLGHAVFFGAGAYSAAEIAIHLNLRGTQGWLYLIPLAGLVGAVIAVPFGLVALRVRRHTFVVVTIAVFFIFQLIPSNMSSLGGTLGISPPFPQNWDPITANNPYYYAALVIAVFAILLAWGVRGSRFGLQLLAIRDDEDRARGLGVKTMRVKLTAFVLSAFITGMVGAVWVFFTAGAAPATAFNPQYDLTVALMGFLGGFGSLAGPVLGALILEPVQQHLISIDSSGYLGDIVLGGLFLAVILFLPRGLLPTGGEWATALRARWARRQAASGGQPPTGAVSTDADAGSGAQQRSGLPSAGSAR
jgi:branched-chain amino acid transport system permease protein